MNWYKKSQNPEPIEITVNNDTYNELGISFNGSKTYYYPNVNKQTRNYISFLLSRKNYKAVEKKLREILEKNKAEAAKLEARYPRKIPDPPKEPQQGQFPFMESSRHFCAKRGCF